MTLLDQIQSYFGDGAAEQLARAVKLSPEQARTALHEGLPLQLDALVDHAASSEGREQVVEAVQNLPRFASVQDALNDADGASNLERAGEMLSPVLLGGTADKIVQTVAAKLSVGQTDAGAIGGLYSGAQRLMQMALPLLLSFLGQRGLNAGNVATMLPGMKGGLAGLAGLGATGTGLIGAGLATGLAGAGALAAGLHKPEVKLPEVGLSEVKLPELSKPDLSLPELSKPEVKVPELGKINLGTTDIATPDLPKPNLGAIGGMAAAGAAGLAGAALTSGNLLDFIKGQFTPAVAEQVGKSAGFGGSTASRATLAALPLVLNALVNKGRTESGANDVLNMARPLGHLAAADGTLNTNLLNDAAETARMEGQGRGLLGGLFGNVEAVTGKLGTALGGSGANAGRLLAILTPLVLGLLGNRARTGGVGAGAFSGLLGGMGGSLAGLLPSGLSSLGGLLGAGAVATTVAAAAPRVSVNAAAVPPRPVTPPAPPVVVKETERKRGGFPWWLIPLALLLLLGGCWLVNRKPAATTGTTTSAAAGGIVVTNPTSDSTLPAAAFTMSGTGRAGDKISIADQGQEVATTTVGTDGNWTANIPAPTVGEHTYSLTGADSAAKSEFKVNIADGAATDPAGSTPAATGDFSITEPAAGATLPAGDFALSGKGTAGQEIELFDGDTSLGKVTVDADGNWTLPVTGAAAGARAYAVKGSDGTELATLSATVGEAGAATETGTGTEADTETAAPDAAASAGTVPAAADFSITTPAADAKLPAGGFALSGKGTPGASVEVFEDGVSLGSATVGADGTWTKDVPSPAEGAHTYAVKASDGTELTTVSATVAAATASAGGAAAVCTKDYTLSITDGQTVKEPFRFGGVGGGTGYSVTIKRGERLIGTKDIKLDGSCGWAYQSRPGKGTVTYEVRPLGDASAKALSTVKLTVAQ
ncbi:DUF937 domain-containing protein [Deinococcus sp. Arct2-2]|uniref:DUF937 domain-containing protein n=1 Tax=Deinococcus sp. Arct2-2 TaxID=2568653 RepID=UPI0010A2F950|nr:DUF937 domain-containing protein [Deinococcus sp. Arct2-2]THF71068.1 DUF937 domain-containing protein [Deinococcus sp. Arct2-2]